MDKLTLLAQIRASRLQLDHVIRQLTDAQWQTPGAVGVMSVKDVMAHIAWYERETTGIFVQHAVNGSPLWEVSLEQRNAAIQAENQSKPLAEVQAESPRVFNALLTVIEPLDERDLQDASLFANMPTEWQPYEVILSNTVEHYDDHRVDIERYLKELS